MFSRLQRRPFLAVLFLIALPVFGDNSLSASRPEITGQTRMQMIRLLNAEYAFVRLPFPRGEKGLELKETGEMSPKDSELRQQLARYGAAAKPGERVQITNVEFKGKAIRFEINGGPKKKTKWYQHIEVGAAGGTVPVAQQPDQNAKGSFLLVEFNKHIPEMSLAELKDILKPVFDFTVKSAAQAYTESLPENVRNAIRDHKVLVGMNKEMVTYSKGRPPQRIREKDDKGQYYEEWIFGEPPQPTEFIRFVGDEVARVEVMDVNGVKEVRTEREVKIDQPAPVQTAGSTQQLPGPPPGQKAPTLRRPGEEAPDLSNGPRGGGPVVVSPPPTPPGTQTGPPLQ